MTPNQIVFLVLALLAVVGALGVVLWGDQPVMSALSLVFNFFVLAFIYFSLGAAFLGITQIMVYAGAIMVLFLFVIMILKLGGDTKKEKIPALTGILAIAGSLATGIVLYSAVFRPFMDNSLTGDQKYLEDFGRPQSVGASMFSDYALPFEVASILLLIGIVGSILLAKRRLS